MKKVTGIGGIFFKCKERKKVTEWYQKHLLPSLKERNWMQFGDILYLNQNTYLAQDSVLRTDYRFIRNGVEEAKTAYHYVMTVAELRRIFRQAGFIEVRILGNLGGEPYKWGDGQAWIVAEKA